jgi:hypothetical protein
MSCLHHDVISAKSPPLLRVKVAISEYSLVVPAKAGTYPSDTPEFASSGNTLPVLEGFVLRRDGPRPFAGVTRGSVMAEFFHALRTAVQERGWEVRQSAKAGSATFAF